ncbi:MAG: hypothetical protein JNL80_00285 [Phycisphaerae bacterium]|nr:hypothetical protein [Phycisphaerae bacterium]
MNGWKSPQFLVAIAFAAFALAVSGAYGQCTGGAGSCLVPHPNPGCEDPDCCGLVCDADPSCCTNNWDADCVLTANQVCVGLCGADVSLSCLVPHDNPACDDEVCCEAVCLIDSFCCDVRWDFSCTFFAEVNCDLGNPGVCGDPKTGSCYEPHPSAACDDAECCAAVCAVSPDCCDQLWDVLCAGLASDVCIGSCQPQCPPESVEENEACEQNVNDPCYFPSANPVLQTLPCGGVACGTIYVSGSSSGIVRDVDVWRFIAADADGDGNASVQLSFSSGFEGFAALVPSGRCPPLSSALTSVNSALCIEALSAQVCVPAGEYRIVVAPGTFPAFGSTTIECDVSDRYFLRAVCEDLLCSPPCNPSAGSCLMPHTTPGCSDIECCELVCASDPSCCDLNWDGTCAAMAADQCTDPPVNETCATAIPIAEGTTPIITLGAQASEPPVPPECFESGGVASQADIWFSFTSPRDAFVEVTTCGVASDFNTGLAVYGGACESLSLLACDDDGGGCLPVTSSTVVFDATCGESYLIRVGGGQGTAGLTLTVFGGPDCVNCPADLDGNGSVGAPDIALLLGAWGAPGAADLDQNGIVSSPDLAILLGAWGPC